MLCNRFLQLNNEMGERKRTEEALRLAEDKYRTLVENIQDGVFVIVDEKLRFVNEAFAKMLGYTVNDIIGADFQITMAPEDRAMVVERPRRTRPVGTATTRIASSSTPTRRSAHSAGTKSYWRFGPFAKVPS